MGVAPDPDKVDQQGGGGTVAFFLTWVSIIFMILWPFFIEDCCYAHANLLECLEGH